MLQEGARYHFARELLFQWAPTLGGECYVCAWCPGSSFILCFNGHPPLGVNATRRSHDLPCCCSRFQWAPTLGGECYGDIYLCRFCGAFAFQWAPTLGGECYKCWTSTGTLHKHSSFNGHPPLGVNATRIDEPSGERCTKSVSMGTHPWG